MKIIPFQHIFHTLWYPQYTQKCEHLKGNTLSTHFMTWMDLTPLFVCTHFHTTLPFQTTVSTRKIGRAGNSTFSSIRPPPDAEQPCPSWIFSISYFKKILQFLGASYNICFSSLGKDTCIMVLDFSFTTNTWVTCLAEFVGFAIRYLGLLY